jgi:hypothetical protein
MKVPIVKINRMSLICMHKCFDGYLWFPIIPFTDISCSSHIMMLATTQDVATTHIVIILNDNMSQYCHSRFFFMTFLDSPNRLRTFNIKYLKWQKLQDYGHSKQ